MMIASEYRLPHDGNDVIDTIAMTIFHCTQRNVSGCHRLSPATIVLDKISDIRSRIISLDIDILAT